MRACNYCGTRLFRDYVTIPIQEGSSVRYVYECEHAVACEERRDDARKEV